tara:strand:- start:450796 stop:451059 length:264 start_codon:yes stop_codon:yes gene_type:complete
MSGLMLTLSYTPFVDAMSIHEQWYLLIVPMVFFVAVGYKAVRVTDMKGYWRNVFAFVVQVLGVMAVLAVGFTIVITVLVPMLAPMPG